MCGMGDRVIYCSTEKEGGWFGIDTIFSAMLQYSIYVNSAAAFLVYFSFSSTPYSLTIGD